jgi:formylglycine-generating enzyme required for sulfatase activity
LVLYSLNDTVQFRTYDAPLTFRRSTTLWVAGVRGDGTRLEPIRIDYVIERNRGNCPPDMVSFELGGEERCMDRFEWPNREDASPQAFVSWREAQDSCTRAGKRLCALEEWQAVCMGPERAKYPYSAPYDERYCPAKEAGPAHSGHFPVCRSYYGSFDMTGNLWEWTSTPHPNREGFYQVAGGNWEGGDQATCKFTRYSFYPQNRFPMVGFRCCDSTR